MIWSRYDNCHFIRTDQLGSKQSIQSFIKTTLQLYKAKQSLGFVHLLRDLVHHHYVLPDQGEVILSLAFYK